MAQIDIQNAVVRFYDGTLGTATLDSTPVDSDLVFTAISKHIGRDKITVTFVDPAVALTALSVVVTGRDIVVTLETDAGPAIASTALEVKTLLDLDAGVAALVTIALETAGAGVVEAIAKTTLDGQNYLEVKIGEGTLSYSEKKTREFTLDRGLIDTVKNADQEPLDVSMDSTWEWVMSSSGESPTAEDCVKQRAEASAWLTSSTDSCAPYCVDVEIYNAPDCSSTPIEIIMLEEFYYETIDHDLREGTLNFSGRCNRQEAVARRVLAADVA